jgi:plastocyanin
MLALARRLRDKLVLPGFGLLLPLAAVFLSGCGEHTREASEEILKAGTSQVADPAPDVDPPQVLIDSFTFKPRQLTVAVGTKVKWVNQDDVPHTVTSSLKPRLFDSGAMETEDPFVYVFTKPGTYEYFCAVHPHMTGRIIVK